MTDPLAPFHGNTPKSPVGRWWIVSLYFAQHLADLGYRGPDKLIWDRYNPQSREGGKPSNPSIAWKLSISRRHFDGDCCLAAPNILKGLVVYGIIRAKSMVAADWL